MCDFSSVFDKLSYLELLECKTQLDTHIKRVKEQHRISAANMNIKDFISQPSPFIDPNSAQYGLLCAELESLNLKQQSNGVATKWLTQTGQPYKWNRANGSATVKEPISFENYPTINALLNKLNSDKNLSLNSCLVSCMRDGRCSLRLHNDDEDSMDQTQPIEQ